MSVYLITPQTAPYTSLL